MKRALILPLAALWVFFAAAPAGAHASLRASDPAAGTELDRSPRSVTLSFTEQPDLSLSSVRVLDLKGRSYTKQKPRADPGDPFTLRVAVEPLDEGVYFVVWRVVSRVDGHLTGTAFSFGVRVDPKDVAAPDFEAIAQGRIPPLGVAGRFLFIAGMVTLVGGVWVSTALFQQPRREIDRLMGASLLVAFVGVAFMIEAQRRTAEVSLVALAPTFLGRALLGRAAALGLAAAALLVASRSESLRRWATATAGLLAAAGIFVHVAAGHGGATSPSEWMKFAAQSTHFAAVAVWVGGLAALLLGIRGTPSDEKTAAVSRFSKVAGVTLAAVVVSGGVRAIEMVGRWDNLFSTAYGRVVIVKVALLTGIVALAAVNRYRNVPRATLQLRGLRRVSTGEVVLATAVLAATALLANLTPPSAMAKPSGLEPPVVAAGSDLDTTMKIRLEVRRLDPRTHRFEINVTDFDTGEPVDAERVSLRFKSLSATEVIEAPLELGRLRAGRYGAKAQDLAIDGRLGVVVLIQKATDATEIALQLAARCRAEVLETEGGPQLHEIALARGTLAQAYIDPGETGANDVYIKFQAGGGELLVRDMNVFASRLRSRLTRLEPRRLSAGNFIAEAKLSPGKWRFDFEAATEDREPLRGCFEQQIARTI